MEYQEEKMELWDQLAFEYDPKSPVRRIWTKNRIWIDAIKDAMQGCKKVLDVGCGAGFPSVFLAKWFDMFCLDRSKNMILLASKRAIEEGVKIKLFRADSCSLPFKDAIFDGVYCKFALWPIKRPEEAIKEMIRVLKPNGKIAIVEVDRKGKKQSISFRSKIFYYIYLRIKQKLFKYPDTSPIWKRLMKETEKNPRVNLDMVSSVLKRNNCNILKIEPKLKEMTYTAIGRLMGSDHEDYFLCVAKKE